LNRNNIVKHIVYKGITIKMETKDVKRGFEGDARASGHALTQNRFGVLLFRILRVSIGM
jgi:hypothetical protein